MGKRLIVAEKPSVGRDIAKVLHCNKHMKGAIASDNDIVTWAVGHLVSQRYPEEMDDKYKEWRLEDLPIIPDPFQLKVLESGEKQFEIIKSFMNDPEVDTIVCATDAGREGELIFRYIYQMAECNKPVDRLWISSLTYSAIKSGFENLRSSSEYDNLYQSARCRSEADWLVGMNGSRAFSIANDLRGVSIGRVLSPTLSILVQREIERKEFVPEEYCELIATFGNYAGRMINPSRADDLEIWSHFPVGNRPIMEQLVAEKPGQAKVSSVRNEKESIPSLQLYDLTSLQRDANKLGYTAKKTLEIAQSLYEKRKAITYPRTDSRYLSSDIKSTLEKRLNSLCFGKWESAVGQALTSEKDLFGRFINNKGVSDHHAIIPTGEAKGMELWSKGEHEIFDLIAGRFIGMFLPNKEVLHQTIETAIGDNTFLSHGEKVLKQGWAEADNSRKAKLEELPDVLEGETVSVTNMRIRTDQTEPPVPHTEASLLNAMEHAGVIMEEDSESDHETEFGIGTPATRAATIEKLLEKQMAYRKGRALMPTEYGMRLVKALPDYLCSPEMTGEWEARLSRISKGSENPDIFMSDICSLTTDLVKYAADHRTSEIKEASVVGKCPVCGQNVKEYPEAYYCENKECGFRRIWKAQKGFHPTLQSGTMRQLLREGKAETNDGVYKIIKTDPYIAYDRKQKPDPQFDKLNDLIAEYGFAPVDKVSQGGSLWFKGKWGDETMEDFVSDCGEVGCFLKYAKDSKALHHNSGWYLQVNPKQMDAYKAAMNLDNTTEQLSEEQTETYTEDDSVMRLIKASGFPFVDKRPKGSLWIIAEKEESRELVRQCATKGVVFVYSKNGSKSTGHRPGWYSK